ncbi:hypothetical protein COLO4_32046 [Corchorus olitorius]|uniref:Uncharacterized protein n=1 Tax=Corchorus olitorius TaxID=93759 RepID=A0A1R3H2K5_9ROSI|nr:hypothetical protein COLO4_32046 [Corchorus olitorius]
MAIKDKENGDWRREPLVRMKNIVYYVVIPAGLEQIMLSQN